jgi:hypothetical protein
MRYSTRIPRLAAAVAVVLTVTLAACADGNGVTGVDGGRVQFLLSSGDAAPRGVASGVAADGPVASDGDRDDDHPRRRFQSANVTLSSILARNVEGVLVNVEMELPVVVDVLSLRDSSGVTLPAGVLPPATYDQLVVVMTQVEVVTLDGTAITITPPGGGWTTIVPVCAFDVADGATTTVGLRFMLAHAFPWRDGHHQFRPRFECDGAGPQH